MFSPVSGIPQPEMSEMVPAPTGTVTFLFTDIEGSTELWDRLPEPMSSAVAAHDALLRRIFSANAGYVFTTAGDSFAVAFAGASDAIAAACQIQREIGNTTLPEVGKLRLRVGMHTGLAETRDGDYFGIDVNIAARVMSAGHGGQILLTDATANLANVVTTPLGQHKIRGIVEPQGIHQLEAEGLESGFGPLRTPSSVRSNLPAMVDEFVGRSDDVSLVNELLLAHRLVTLIGPGGAGKTRLGIEIAREITAEGGVWFVDLAPVTDGLGILFAIADTVGIEGMSARPLRDQVLSHLAQEPIMLVLDNCEHLIDEVADLVSMLLRRCPYLRILTTSREALEVPGESLQPVGPLGLPGEHDSLDSILAAPAVQLFAVRASAARPSFNAVADDPDAVARICKLVDGLPLAIELAASRIRAMSPRELADRLGDRMSVLDVRRGRDTRHRTLTAVVEWSYDLLLEEERTAFIRLSVFAGGFTAAAAESVIPLGDLPPVDVFDLIIRLVERSLVTTESGESGTTRFRLLEPLRAFSRDRLQQSGPEVSLHLDEAHLAWALGLIGDLETAMRTTGQDAALRAVKPDHDNLRAARRHAEDRGDSAAALRIVTSAPIDSNRERLDAIIDALGRTVDAPPELRARACYTAVGACFESGQFERGLPYGREAVTLFDDLGDQSQRAYGLMMLAFCHWGAGVDGVGHLLSEAIESFDSLDDTMGRAYINWVLSQWRMQSEGADDIAESQARLGVELFLSLDAPYGEAHAREGLGYILGASQRQSLAMSEMIAAVQQLRSLGNLACVAHALDGVATVFVQLGRPAEGAEVLGAADRLRGATGAAERPWEIDARAKCVEGLHAALDEQTLRHHMAFGAALSLDDVITRVGHAQSPDHVRRV